MMQSLIALGGGAAIVILICGGIALAVSEPSGALLALVAFAFVYRLLGGHRKRDSMFEDEEVAEK